MISPALLTLKAFGYDKIVVSQEEDHKNTIEKRIKKITAGGADFAFDPLAGDDLLHINNSLKLHHACTNSCTNLSAFRIKPF